MACVGLAFAGQTPAASRPDLRSKVETDAQFEALPLVRTHQNHLLVRAVINDKPALLIVDTGSPGTVIASKRCAYYHVGRITADSQLPSRVQVNGSYNKLVMAQSLRLGGLNVADVPAVAVDLSGARHSARMMHEVEADGILGADVLFATRAVLDCQRQLLILNLRPELPGNAPGMDYRGFQKMPIYVSEGFNLYVDGTVNGSPARLMIDTGAFTTLLHRGFVRQLHIPTEETRLQSAAINLKEEGVDVARIRKLSFGLVNILGKDVGVVDLGGVLHEGLQRNPPAVGLLGAEILKRNHGIIDFGTRTLYLRAESPESLRKARRQSGTTRAIDQRLLAN
jgi:predicted aspartyl protease